jgi:hypothetical protein
VRGRFDLGIEGGEVGSAAGAHTAAPSPDAEPKPRTIVPLLVTQNGER